MRGAAVRLVFSDIRLGLLVPSLRVASVCPEGRIFGYAARFVGERPAAAGGIDIRAGGVVVVRQWATKPRLDHATNAKPGRVPESQSSPNFLFVCHCRSLLS
jgi:hypothetical protein